ncbi:MAG: hypothetical protein QOJ46_9 [bacterium]
MGSRVRCATSVLCACALLGGCGDDGGGASSATAPAAAAASAPITIARPLDGSRVRATRTPRGRLRARTKASGRASPGGSVFLSASCRPVRCKARATAGADGRWSASMTLTTTAAATFVTIDASSQARVSSTGSAVTTVELAGPRVGSGAGDGGASASGAGDGGGASASGTRRRAAAPPLSAPPPSAGPALPHDVLVIGDSLAVGMADYLRAALPGWRVRIDGKISRPLAVGMRILAQEPDVPAIVAMSLFTNDDPSATAALEQAVRATATRPGACAVWATIVRPPYNGVSYDAANRVLVRLGSRLPGLRLADWAGAVAQSPSFVGGDGVHATPEGYRARGELYAAAIRQCAGEG